MVGSEAGRGEVLLVHGDPGVRARVQGLLQGSGWSLRLAGDLAEAFAEPRPCPDCLLLGVPDHPSGSLRELRLASRIAPEAAVVLLVAGDGNPLLAPAAEEEGADGALALGSLSPFLLRRAIHHAVERKRAIGPGHLLKEAEARSAERSRLERGLLPHPLVRDERLRCVTLYRPGTQQALLGGDFYDVVELDDGTVLAVIGDVAGHGPDQAAFGVQLRVAWRALALVGLAGPHSLSALEQVLLAERQDPELFVTACEIAVTPERDRAVVRSAGHPPPLLLGRDGSVAVPPVPVGPPLGVVEGACWPPLSLDLAAHPELLLYTDGLVEGFTGPDRRDRLGVEGLVRIVTEQRPSCPDLGALVAEVVRQVEKLHGGELVDDVALLGLALQYEPEGSGT